MKIEHTSEETTVVSTAFRFTEDEVIEALAQWIESQDSPVPRGSRFVSLRPERQFFDWFVTLRVNHSDTNTEVLP